MRKIICGMIIVLLLASVFPLAFNVQMAKASPGTIYIRAGGLVDPPSAPIWNVGNVYYTFTGDISDQLVVERDNIIVNGAGHTILGANTGTGVNLTGRSNVTIKTLTIKKFSYGIFLSGSSGNTLYANRIANNTCGIRLYAASHSNSISANTITNSTDGIYLYSSSNSNSISANTIANSTSHGIWLASSYSNSISANALTNNYYGVYLSFSYFNSIFRNTVTNSTSHGVYLSSSTAYYNILAFSYYNNVSGNTITNNDRGIYLDSSSGNSISANTITNNNYGIQLAFSSNSNSISENTITNNDFSIHLSSSSSNSISANTITNSKYASIDLAFSSGNSISANTITNNNYGIKLDHSSSNSISENTITNNYYYGIYLDSSSGNSISGNTITNNNDRGIYLDSSSGNSISANTITNNNYGIYLAFSSNSNSISENTITNNNKNGIHLDSSSGNSISGNTITNNNYGIYLSQSSGNFIWHNNFVSNTVQAFSQLGYVNVWDGGYPSGGNYWSDYAGFDLYKGPAQNVVGTDEIGDTAYTLDSDNRDHYPLMNPYVALTNVTSLVVRGGDNKVWYRTYSGGVWGGWYPIAAATGDSLGAAIIGNDLHIVARNLAGTTIWHGYVNLATNVFSGWTLISGSPVSAPTLASNGTHLSLVVRGGDNKVWYRTYSSFGGWGSWNPIASATGDSLGAAMIGNNLHIIARNLAGTTIWHGYVNLATNTFSGWTLISGVPVSAPTLTSNGTMLSLVVRGGDNKIWYRTYNGGVWGSWHSIAAATGDSPAATMLGNNLHIVARDISGTTLWHGYVDVTTNVFSGWTLISGHPVSKPTLTS